VSRLPRWVLAAVVAAALIAQVARARDLLRAQQILRSVEARSSEIARGATVDPRVLRAHLLALEDAERLDRAEVGVAIARGNQYLLLSANESAIEAYRAAQRLERRPETHLNLGEALLQLDRREEALVELGWALRLDPMMGKSRIPAPLRAEITTRSK
jgi:tetratricopeptide (TPR) repeat protein